MEISFIRLRNTHSNNNIISIDYYKDFHWRLDDEDTVPISEYVYFYSLCLHFACVLHADMGVQQICNNMVRKNQEMIEKFLDYLFKIGKCERTIVESAIEEAGKKRRYMQKIYTNCFFFGFYFVCIHM